MEMQVPSLGSVFCFWHAPNAPGVQSLLQEHSGSKDVSPLLLQLPGALERSRSSKELDPVFVMSCSWELVRWHLEGMYGAVKEGMDNAGIKVMRVMGAVDVKLTNDTELMLEWLASASNDMVADSVIEIIMGIDRSPASVKLTTHPHVHSHTHAHTHIDDEDLRLKPISGEVVQVQRIEKIITFLEAHFGEVAVVEPEQQARETEKSKDADTSMENEDGQKEEDNMDEDTAAQGLAILVKLDEHEARIGLLDMIVRSSHYPLRKRVESVLQIALTTTASLSELYVSGDIDTRRVREGEDENLENAEARLEDVPSAVEVK